jgi:hypothetical protein
MKLSNKAAARLASLINSIEVWSNIACKTLEERMRTEMTPERNEETHATLTLANDNYDREIIALFNEFGVKLPNYDKALERMTGITRERREAISAECERPVPYGC